jgi:hypothetical protein
MQHHNPRLKNRYKVSAQKLAGYCGLGNAQPAADFGSATATGNVQDKIKQAAITILAKYNQGINNGTITQKAAHNYFTNSRIASYPGLTLDQTRQAYRMAYEGLQSGTASGTLTVNKPLPTPLSPPMVLPELISEQNANEMIARLNNHIEKNNAYFAQYKNAIYTNANNRIKAAIETIKMRTVKQSAPATPTPAMSDPVRVIQPPQAAPQPTGITDSINSGISALNDLLKQGAGVAEQYRDLREQLQTPTTQPIYTQPGIPGPQWSATGSGGGQPIVNDFWNRHTPAELTPDAAKRVQELNTGGVNMNNLLMIGGLAIGAFLLMGKRGR